MRFASMYAVMVLVGAAAVIGCDVPTTAVVPATPSASAGQAAGGGETTATGLCPTIRSAETRSPALVSVLLDVEDCDGRPIAGLSIENIEFLEDGEPISAFESRPGFFPVQGTFDSVNVLLLDLSGSVVADEAGMLGPLKDAARRYASVILADAATPRTTIAIHWFDGAATVGRLIDFTDDRAHLLAAIDSITSETARDDSTNLHGGLIAGLDLVERERDRLLAAGAQAALGSLVLFTDGTDRAGRSTETQAQNRLRAAGRDVLVQTIGLGAEINHVSLNQFGRDGFEFAEDTEQIAAAFERAARRVQDEANSIYLIRYCSPRRAGVANLEVRVRVAGLTGSVNRDFSAAGFGPGCDPDDASGRLLQTIVAAPLDRVDVPRVRDAVAAPPPTVTRPYPLRFTNSCHREVRLALRYRDGLGEWHLDHWWRFQPLESSLLTATGGAPLMAASNELYFYAETTDGSDLVWTATPDEGWLAPLATSLASPVVMRSATARLGAEDGQLERRLGINCRN
jgi:hypothetical protein